MLGRARTRAYALAQRVRASGLAWGTDVLFDDGAGAARQGDQLAKLARWFTAGGGAHHGYRRPTVQLLALSGPRNPYPGRVIGRRGARAPWADLLLVDGNPLDELSPAWPTRTSNLAVIMKDGVIHKNSLTGARG